MISVPSRHVAAVASAAVLWSIGSPAHAVDVWLNFGAGLNNDDSTNSTWITELNELAADAGITAFNATERGQIESLVLSELNRIYAGYNLAFTTTNPGGNREVIDFGRNENAHNPGVLGFAGLDFANKFPNQVTNMIPRNFGFVVDEFSGSTNRAAQITQLGTALAGTAAHELGHSFGLHHHHAYGVPGINPANYNNTGGLQNTTIIATGGTGLGEAGRESQRNLGEWERVVLDVTGAFGSGSLITGSITGTTEAGDAGDSPGTAQAITLNTGPGSGVDIGFVRGGTIDGLTTDQDWYELTLSAPGRLTAETWSVGQYADTSIVDTVLALFGPDGSTQLALDNNINFSGNAFNSGSDQDTNSFLLNIPIAAAGTYYLRVTPFNTADLGDAYDLLVGFVAVPEPTGFAALALGTFSLLLRRAKS